MPEFRRACVPGGTFFFTVVTYQRARFLCTAPARHLLRTVLRQCRQRWPMETNAFVLLPDHLHAIWTLPPDDSDFSRRWAWIKKEFCKRWLETGGVEGTPSEGERRGGRRGVWQPKFWEHLICDDGDFERHADYLHYNPVKHGLVRSPRDWPYSSFHRWVRLGHYPREWGAVEDDLGYSDIEVSAME